MATDSEMLQALLSDDRLTDEERTSFQDMKDSLRPGRSLSRKQRSWVEGRWTQLELDSSECLNLASSGKVPLGKSPPMEYKVIPKPPKMPGRDRF